MEFEVIFLQMFVKSICQHNATTFHFYCFSVEEQAMDRVHRIGQTRETSVVKYVMDGSIEERILKIQQKKQLLNKGALGKLTSAEIRSARLADLRSIFSD